MKPNFFKPFLFQHRLTESPEAIRLSKTVEADYTHPSAVAFAVIHNVVATTTRTHLWIFNALRKAMDSPERAARIYEDYDVVFVPHNPEAEDMAWFAENDIREMGEQREVTFSGRAWRAVQVEGETISAMSFWSTHRVTHVEILDKIIRALGLKDPVFVEFVDSVKPSLYKSLDLMELELTYPGFTEKQIIDILVRAHVEPQTLTPVEKKVAEKFRGEREASLAGKLGGYMTGVVGYKTIGDSLKIKVAR